MITALTILQSMSGDSLTSVGGAGFGAPKPLRTKSRVHPGPFPAPPKLKRLYKHKRVMTTPIKLRLGILKCPGAPRKPLSARQLIFPPG